MTLCERIKSAKRNRRSISIHSGITERRRSNCRGTALYLAGVVEKEVERGGEEARELIGDLEILEEPETPCLAIFKRNRGKDYFISHMGVITGVNPLRITHRDGHDGPFFENEPMKKVLRRYSRYEVEYRRITLP